MRYINLVFLTLLCALSYPVCATDSDSRGNAVDRLATVADSIATGSHDLNAIVKPANGEDSTSALREFTTMLRDAYVEVEHERSHRKPYLQALQSIYSHSENIKSYRGMMIATIAKQMAMEMIWVELSADWALLQTDHARLDAIEEIVDQFSLDPDDLSVFINKEADKPDQSNNPNKNLIVDLRDRIWKSHGSPDTSTALYEWFQEVGGIQYATTEALLFDSKSVLAAKTVIETEVRRVMNTKGAIEYLRRDGDPRQLSLTDIRPFYDVISQAETFKFTYPVGHGRKLTVHHLKAVFDHDRNATTELAPGQEVPASWAGLIFSPRE